VDNKHRTGTTVYPHMPRACSGVPRELAVSGGDWCLSASDYRQYLPSRADSSAFGLLGEQSSHKIGDSLTMTPLNHRAKFDAASFILAGEIRNRTNKHAHKRTVTDISTPCLLACVDNYRVVMHAGMKASPRFREASAYIKLRHQPPQVKYPLLALHIAANPQAYDADELNVRPEVTT